MNFLEAVKAMKEGKKVMRTDHNGEEMFFWMVKGMEGYKLNYSGVTGVWSSEIEATDWEVVDEDEEWNLQRKGWTTPAASLGIRHPGTEEIFMKEDVKKCRDLILEDIFSIGEEVFGKDTRFNAEMNQYFQVARSIIYRRFGDLK